MTVRESLETIVSHDVAEQIADWLDDVLDDHTLEVDGAMVEPSLSWLVEALKHG